jgi:hypothetical protein
VSETYILHYGNTLLTSSSYFVTGKKLPPKFADTDSPDATTHSTADHVGEEAITEREP